MKSVTPPRLIHATSADQPAIQNMARFYIYDMSRHCGEESGWELPEDGLYECLDLSPYFQKKNHFPFLIRIKQELAGFVLVNKIGTSPDVDWNLGEFFILAKFQGKGIGSAIAFKVFDLFRGIWEVTQMPKNLPAIQFWKKVVKEYTAGQFRETFQIISEPKPHPMIVLRFSSKNIRNGI